MTSKPTDGGAAFPQSGMASCEPGMSLRDWFAGQVLARESASDFDDDNTHLAFHAYAVADIMLAERERTDDA